MGKFFIAIIAISIALVLGTALLVTYFLVRGLIQFCSLRTNRRARNPGPTSLKDMPTPWRRLQGSPAYRASS
jgi:hypothetical protein